MDVTIRKVTLWRKDVENRPGTMAEALAPLAAAGASLEVAMGYRVPGDAGKAVLEVAPIGGKKQTAAARGAGFAPAPLPAILVTGDDRPGVGHAIAAALGAAGVNLAFLVAQVTGRKWTAVFGFDSEADLKKGVPILRKAAAKPKRK